jgi:hypothetical protein
VVPSGKHELLNGSAELLHRTTLIACGEFSDSAIDIGLAPEQAGPVVEEVEVVGVIALLLNDLELNVLVIQSLVINGAVGIGEFESGRADSGAAVFLLWSFGRSGATEYFGLSTYLRYVVLCSSFDSVAKASARAPGSRRKPRVILERPSRASTIKESP